MNIGKNIKIVREQKKLLQKEVAAVAGMLPSNYSKIEKGEREPSIEALEKISRLFGMTIDELIHLEGKVPSDIRVEDKTIAEKLRLIEQLEEEDRQALYRIIDTMLTKSKFKDFFQKNMLD
ncbi:helix-turn-helix transcriptional regulator [Chitinophaga sp. CB10]|uniref:helix-turn-helix domain-containing protein n=1 Tax=Chitinophaga sp. CB10 TaxID=1891659 RepID=UPI0025BDBFCE|nr:helix-turn-helix transcriptional regulator [Chitinophaga sp. CB10]